MADGGLYAKKLILAPMVRAGRTPLRTLALEYGADLVYTEEIIDQKLLGSQRTINDILGTTDYTYEDDVVLRICNRIEKQKCVLQIGTNDAQRAANVVKKVENDVAAIDINMGCPKPFSIAGGMGAALLGSPERAKEIVQTCVSISTIPVSCKMRVLDKREDTLEFVKMLERCGVSAIGIHGRRRSERQSDMNRLNEIHEVTRVVSVPVIANGFSGSIKEYADIMRFWKQSGASSVMIARKALSNPSIFRPKGFISFEEEICGFLEMACKYDENFTSTKYVVQRILGSKQETDERGRETVLAGSVSDICKAWSISDTYQCYKNIGRRATQKRRFEVDSETGISFIDLTFPPNPSLFGSLNIGMPSCCPVLRCNISSHVSDLKIEVER
ncbi:dihydrouridine synthase domain-containing protein, variant [Loa loa]|uniref:Dihydrouridine synthase domain-containing protein, variant n=1 Tax=Loa loa TaxID=7209 RepID=A0A1S0UFQ0_LOALO|nr:dihydrouridine synthase domain-containing protein, variant [Loa loa]EJD74188.1 dihydrouridine synthase domain-containing protein, variant [Loa loa]